MGRLDTMLLWGHSLADYAQKFSLSEEDLHKSILDYGAGPGSFNAQMYAQGRQVVSCDALYDQDEQALETSLEKEFVQMLATVQQDQQCFVWNTIKDVQQLEHARREMTTMFLQDYSVGRQQGPYRCQAYPQLDFANHEFELALASHAVFITNGDKPPAYLVDMLMTLARIAQEVRVFPLLDGGGNTSPLVGPVLLGLQQQGLNTEVREVPYEFQRGGNAMLRLWVDSCEIN